LNSETAGSHALASSSHVTVATKHINPLKQIQRVTKCPCILCNPHSATCHFPKPYEFSIRDILFLSAIILSSRLCLGLPTVTSPSGLPTNALYLSYHSREPRASLGRSTNREAPRYPIFCIFLLPLSLMPKHFTQHHIFNTLKLCRSSRLFLL